MCAGMDVSAHVDVASAIDVDAVAAGRLEVQVTSLCGGGSLLCTSAEEEEEEERADTAEEEEVGIDEEGREAVLVEATVLGWWW
jgi:hypothetical protein